MVASKTLDGNANVCVWFRNVKQKLQIKLLPKIIPL